MAQAPLGAPLGNASAARSPAKNMKVAVATDMFSLERARQVVERKFSCRIIVTSSLAAGFCTGSEPRPSPILAEPRLLGGLGNCPEEG